MSLPVHLDQLRMTNERAQSLRRRITTCADAFDGSMPQEASRPERPDASSTLNNQFGEVISSIQMHLDASMREIERLEDQILDNKAGSMIKSGIAPSDVLMGRTSY